MAGISRGAHALAAARRLPGRADQPALIRDAGLALVAHVAAATAVQDVVDPHARRATGAGAAGTGEQLTGALIAQISGRAREAAATAVLRVDARIDAGATAVEQGRHATLDTARVEAGAVGTVTVARAAGAERAGSAVSTAIEIGLRAVELHISAARGRAPLAGADAALTISRRQAGTILEAGRARAAAVDVGLAAVAQPIATRTAHAHAPRTDHARAVGRREAGARQLTRRAARSPTVDVALFSVARSVGARPRAGRGAGEQDDTGDQDAQQPLHRSTPLQLVMLGQPSGRLVCRGICIESSHWQVSSPSHASQLVHVA